MTRSHIRVIRSLMLLALIGLGLATASCADEGEGGGTDAETTTSLAPVSTESTVANWVPGDAVTAALEAVVEQHPDARLFAPLEVPAGTTLAEGWWPVATLETPPPREEWLNNPRVFPGAEQVEVRLVLRTEDGWIELLQALQGDLGDLPGDRTILVDGREASLHSMLGGTVVQWGEGAEWYAVFARGHARQDVVRFAEGMRPLPSPGWDEVDSASGSDGAAPGAETTMPSAPAGSTATTAGGS